MRVKHLAVASFFVMAGAFVSGCATAPYNGHYGQYGFDRVATTSLGLGAFGTALGYAATGDATWAAVGGLSGLAGGFILGQSMEDCRPTSVVPPPVPRSRYEDPYEPEYGPGSYHDQYRKDDYVPEYGSGTTYRDHYSRGPYQEDYRHNARYDKYRRERCRTVTRTILEDGVVVGEYQREVCDDDR